MRIASHSYDSIVLNESERKAFEIVQNVLRNVQDMYEEDTVLISQMTGEVTDMDCISRARGVLGFFCSDELPFQIYSVE